MDNELNTAEPLEISDVISAAILFEKLNVSEQEEILVQMKVLLNK